MAITTTPALPVSLAGRVPGLRRLRGHSGVTWVAAVWVLLLLLAAVAPGLLASDDPTRLRPSLVLMPPGEGVFGTDQYGRDLYTLMVHGTRSALLIGVCSTVLGLVVGSAIGLVAGYAGGWVDMLVGRLLDVLMAFPGILTALLIAASLGPSTRNLVLAVGLALVPVFARVARGQVMVIRSRLFVEAARSNGFSAFRILWRHVLPNSLAPVVVLGTINVGTSIVLAASLSFLGLGPRNEVPDWGQVLSTGQPYMATAWWITTIAGLVLTLTVIAISLLGDSLRDRLEV
ncbi:ABC transporter permease subunit [Auraticoccus sp. F435]|uniref:ABC transporter permease subunit n=1 Tax=Auraticoccus cholistanensis TaxID=2656650 RepID=A0A6A9V067_9ACTN|nr:ABC transporter permease [Auraticoccus cholistanensis]MVA74900.1 ABC transporter permease subunit [Auraticoccus cholistanensis]